MKEYIPLFENESTYSTILQGKSIDEAETLLSKHLEQFTTIPKQECRTFDGFLEQLNKSINDNNIYGEYVSSKDITKGDEKSIFVIYNFNFIDDKSESNTLTVGLRITDDGDDFTMGKYYYDQ